jgi:flagellar hook assembly protein FlgD
VATKSALTAISPNPFNPETTIHFNLNAAARPSLAIYNVAGQLVREAELGNLSGGANAWVWDGRDNRGNPLASGVYFVRLQAGAVTDVKKAILLK